MQEIGGVILGLIILVPVVILSVKEVKSKVKGGCNCSGGCALKDGRY